MKWRKDMLSAEEFFNVLVGWEDGSWAVGTREEETFLGAQQGRAFDPQPDFWAEVKGPNQ